MRRVGLELLSLTCGVGGASVEGQLPRRRSSPHHGDCIVLRADLVGRWESTDTGTCTRAHTRTYTHTRTRTHTQRERDRCQVWQDPKPMSMLWRPSCGADKALPPCCNSCRALRSQDVWMAAGRHVISEEAVAFSSMCDEALLIDSPRRWRAVGGSG